MWDSCRRVAGGNRRDHGDSAGQMMRKTAEDSPFGQQAEDFGSDRLHEDPTMQRTDTVLENNVLEGELSWLACRT